MIRAFVALTLPPALHETLEGLQSGLAIGRVVPPENFHLTLAFLGTHPRPVLEDLHLVLEQISLPAFDISIAGLGVFGGRSPRALYADIAASPELSLLRSRIHAAAREAGIQPDSRKFLPHITLARFSGPGGQDLADLERFVARRIETRAGPFRIGAVGLYRSHLGAGAPVYDLMAEYLLQ
ncbi:MAG: RNA 2',3'-cyclic phosphodiesterase [Pseudomonadota bacterium]